MSSLPRCSGRAPNAAIGRSGLSFGHTPCQGKCTTRKRKYRTPPGGGSLFLRGSAWSQVEVGWRSLRKPPVDVGLLLELVIGVCRLDRSGEGLLEHGKVLVRDGLLERLPILCQILVDR